MFFIIFFIFFATILADHPPKRYTINLDEHPSQRWNQVISDHVQYLPGIVEESKKYIPAFAQPIVWWLSEKLVYFFELDYRLELEGIALQSGLPLGEVVGLNILYDITAFDRKHILRGLGCTSIVAQNEEGQIFHGRNLDYDMSQLLKNITFIGDFQRNGKTVYTGVSFAMYNGLLTGQRPGAFSVSLNARYSGAYVDNILMEFYTRFKKPVSFLIRDVLDVQTTFEAALTRLSTEKLISPSYIILAGKKSGEGALISRNRWGPADVYRLMPEIGRWFLVETNFDNWKEQKDLRRLTAIKGLKTIGKSNLTQDNLYDVLSMFPVKNNLTIFTSILSPENPALVYKYTNVID